jgi:hypothetical protein
MVKKGKADCGVMNSSGAKNGLKSPKPGWKPMKMHNSNASIKRISLILSLK